MLKLYLFSALGILTVSAEAVVADRPLVVAAIQYETNASDPSGNLRKAEQLVHEAVQKGAELIVLPEFFYNGYTYQLKGRQYCEPREGVAGSFLRNTARNSRVWIGGTIYEKRENGCFNTFLLVSPDGEEYTHRKSFPAGYEGYFFAGANDPFVVETSLGRIALVICAEAGETRILKEVLAHKPQLVLVAHSSPGVPRGLARLLGGPPKDILYQTMKIWAKSIGSPVVDSSVTGRWSSELPFLPLFRLRLPFYGQSGVYDWNGEKVSALWKETGIAIGTVTLKADPIPSIPLPTTRNVIPRPPLVGFVMKSSGSKGKKSYSRWVRTWKK